VTAKISTINQTEARLQGIRMSVHKRLEAQAELARAEAAVELLSDIAGGLARVVRKLVLRPYRKLTASLG
jgi:hypothetical protein